MTALSSFSAGLAALAGERRRRLAIALDASRRGLLERGELLGAGVDQRQVGGMARGQRIEAVDRHVVLARRGTQREQPLLDALELARIVVGGRERRLEMRARLVERGERGVERLHRRLDQRRRMRGAALEPPHRRRQRRHRRLRAGDRVMRLAQVARDLLDLHHGGAPLGERGFFRRLRAEPAQFLDRMAQPVGLALRALDVGAMRGKLLLAGAAFVPQPRDRPRLVVEVAKGVEQPAVGRGVDQRAVVVLAVDLDQRRRRARAASARSPAGR